MSFQNLPEKLSQGWFFNPRLLGLRRVKTVVKKWLDEHTEERVLKHLFSKNIKSIVLPSPREFAIKISVLGWWTTDSLLKAEFDQYKKKLEEVKARLLKELHNPLFLLRFKEIAEAYDLSPEELLDSIRISLPLRRIQIIEMNETQRAEVESAYKSGINEKVELILISLRELLTNSLAGRKNRAKHLERHLAIASELDVVGYRRDILGTLKAAYNSILILNEAAFPKTQLEKVVKSCDEPRIREGIIGLLRAASNKNYWRLR